MKKVKKIRHLKENDYLLLEAISNTDTGANGVYKISDMIPGNKDLVHIVGINIDNEGQLRQKYIDDTFYVYLISRKKDPEYFLWENI